MSGFRIDWPGREPKSDAGLAIDEAMRAQVRRNLAAREVKARDSLAFTARVFAEVQSCRGRFDPRRLGDRYVVRECERLVALSESQARP